MNHNHEAVWIGRVKSSVNVRIQEAVETSLEDVENWMRVPNWRAPGPDGIQGYCLKKFSSLNECVSKFLNHCVLSGNVPEWMVQGRTMLLMKEPENNLEVGNYRPIVCLNLL